MTLSVDAKFYSDALFSKEHLRLSQARDTQREYARRGLIHRVDIEARLGWDALLVVEIDLIRASALAWAEALRLGYEWEGVPLCLEVSDEITANVLQYFHDELFCIVNRRVAELKLYVAMANTSRMSLNWRN
jgi:hypothetical protein